MSRSRKELDGAILSELRALVASLREKPYEDLALLPEVTTDEVTVLGKEEGRQEPPEPPDHLAGFISEIRYPGRHLTPRVPAA